MTEAWGLHTALPAAGGEVRWAQGRWGGGCGAFANVALGAAEGLCYKGRWF